MATASVPMMDEKEIEKFQSMADIFWDITSPAKYLHSMNKLRIPFLINSLKTEGTLSDDVANSDKPLKDLKILDVGCGSGIMSEELCRLGGKVVGVDGVPEMINVAIAHAARDKDLTDLQYISEPIQSFAAKNTEQFDAIVASEVLEHVSDKAGVIAASAKCLKPGGSFVITTESKTWLSKVVTIWWIEHIIKVIPKGAHEIEMYITPEETQKLLEENNCTVRSVRGTFYNAFANKWHYSPFVTWYIMHAVKNQTKE